MSAQTSDQPNNDMLYEVADNIATITFNRPEQKNTISRDMLASFTELLIKADADEEVRAIVITGTGKFFCAGLDLRGSDISEGLFRTAHVACRLRWICVIPRPCCTISTRPLLRHLTVPLQAMVWTWPLAVTCASWPTTPNWPLLSPPAASCRNRVAHGFCRDSSAGQKPAKLFSLAKPDCLRMRGYGPSVPCGKQ